MANRYIIKGATYNGDGTSSVLATVAGGVGAWNDITIFEGTTPPAGSTLPAGTTVFIRSKDAAGGTITMSYAASKTLGNSSATELAPITWVIDAGVVWTGVSGVVTYNMTDRVSLSTRDYNNFIASPARNLVFSNTLSSVTDVGAVAFGKCSTENVKIDMSVCSSANGPYISYVSSVHSNLWVLSNRRYRALFWPNGTGNSLALIAPKIELLSNFETYPLFIGEGGYNGEAVTVYGGAISGAGAAGSAVVFSAGYNAGSFRSFGLSYPREMQLSNASWMGGSVDAFATGADDGMGGEYVSYYYVFDSRADNNPPTLNAALENSSNQAWSYKVYPYRTSPQKPALLAISKTYTQAAASKTITQEILWPTSMAAPTKNQVYLSVQYTDSVTGLKVYQSTRMAVADTLDSSAAGWSASIWGAVTLTKYKLSLTTGSAIKTDTSVTVTLSIAPRSATVNDVIFVDPDVTLS